MGPSRMGNQALLRLKGMLSSYNSKSSYLRCATVGGVARTLGSRRGNLGGGFWVSFRKSGPGTPLELQAQGRVSIDYEQKPMISNKQRRF